MNRSGDNYTSRGWIAVTALIAVLVGVGFIPPQTIGGVKLRRANILSDLIVFDEARAEEPAETGIAEEEILRIDIDSVAECIAATAVSTAEADPDAPQLTYAWRLLPDSVAFEREIPTPDSVCKSPALVPIEDFSGERGRMQAFYDTLLHARRPVRIAFLGDSFVEGDILTADLREELQRVYGGGGTGFAPMASPLTAFRRSVKTQSKGWTAYNIMQRKNVPEAMRSQFYLSGWLCQASEGASTSWSATDFRDRIADCREARILFVSPSESRVEVTLNDTLCQTFTVSGDRAVRQIVVTAPSVQQLAFRVAESDGAFVGYGAVFDGGAGVSVDNYSIRSNNGRAIFWSSPSVDAQVDALLHYDLVVLQYGLNIMQQGVHRYTAYGEQLDQMIAFVRECFPGAAVLLLGVSDRSVKSENGFEPMDAVPSLTACQREAAERAGAAFWPTCEAMQSWGGMAAFVANGWAGKDYTHINYEGGRRIAWSLADALHAGVKELCERIEAERRLQMQQENVFDSLQYRRIGEQLLPELTPNGLGRELD